MKTGPTAKIYAYDDESNIAPASSAVLEVMEDGAVRIDLSKLPSWAKYIVVKGTPSQESQEK